MTVREWLAEYYPDYPEMLLMDEHENAFVGVCERFGQEPVALYDKDMLLTNLVADGCSLEEAIEHFEFNIIGGWVGEFTPAFCVRLSGGERT